MTRVLDEGLLSAAAPFTRLLEEVEPRTTRLCDVACAIGVLLPLCREFDASPPPPMRILFYPVRPIAVVGRGSTEGWWASADGA